MAATPQFYGQLPFVSGANERLSYIESLVKGLCSQTMSMFFVNVCYYSLLPCYRGAAEG